MLDLFDVCNRTVLYVSHDIDEACRLCQRICVMHGGHGRAHRAHNFPG